jgi:hypothetical protein
VREPPALVLDFVVVVVVTVVVTVVVVVAAAAAAANIINLFMNNCQFLLFSGAIVKRTSSAPLPIQSLSIPVVLPLEPL